MTIQMPTVTIDLAALLTGSAPAPAPETGTGGFAALVAGLVPDAIPMPGMPAAALAPALLPPVETLPLVRQEVADGSAGEAQEGETGDGQSLDLSWLIEETLTAEPPLRREPAAPDTPRAEIAPLPPAEPEVEAPPPIAAPLAPPTFALPIDTARIVAAVRAPVAAITSRVERQVALPADPASADAPVSPDGDPPAQVVREPAASVLALPIPIRADDAAVAPVASRRMSITLPAPPASPDAGVDVVVRPTARVDAPLSAPASAPTTRRPPEPFADSDPSTLAPATISAARTDRTPPPPAVAGSNASANMPSVSSSPRRDAAVVDPAPVPASPLPAATLTEVDRTPSGAPLATMPMPSPPIGIPVEPETLMEQPELVAPDSTESIGSEEAPQSPAPTPLDGDADSESQAARAAGSSVPGPASSVSTPVSTAPAPVAPPALPVASAAPTIEPVAGAAPAAPSAPAPVVATATPPADPRALDTARADWIETLVERFEVARDAAGLRQAAIRLAPDALGMMEVTVVEQRGEMRVTLTVETPQARALIADAAPRLAELAEARGLKLGETTVDLGRGGERRPQPRDADGPMAPPSAQAADSDVPRAANDRIA